LIKEASPRAPREHLEGGNAMNIARLLVIALVATALSSATAQGAPLPEAAAEALDEGRAAVSEALETYGAQYPDRPLWQQAFRLGRQARSLAPGHAEPLRFLAEAYSRSNWYGPAWNAWLEYLGTGETLDADSTPLFTEIGAQQGFNLYRQGKLTEAAEVYRKVIDEVPFDLDSHAWMGRILVEMGQPRQAISYWQTVVERNPSDERAEYFLDLAREQAMWGTGAVNAFREGVAFYEEGSLAQARERFARASTLNQRYPEAWAWLGRVAFDTQNYRDARTFYERATRLAPGNDTYSYFFEEAGRRAAAPAREDAGRGRAGEELPGGVEQGRVDRDGDETAGDLPGAASEQDDRTAPGGADGDARDRGGRGQ
jgi:tetratricopeptide (TPR) repeat protein